MPRTLVVVKSEDDISLAICEMKKALRDKEEGEEVRVVLLDPEKMKELERVAKEYWEDMVRLKQLKPTEDEDLDESLEVIDGVLGDFHNPDIKTIEPSGR